MASMSPKLSIIVPFFNEEESIGPLYRAITNAIDPLQITYEMVFVDDGSVDKTVALATELARHDPRVRLVKFRRNYGQTPAMAAGIEHARGEILVTMDGDLQNDPADIGLFLEKMAEGYDIVVGWRHNRQDKLISRKIPSRIANRLIAAMASIAGPRIAEIKVRHHARQFGKSKYGLSRVYKVLLDLMVIKTVASFTSRPLLWFSILTLPMLFAGTITLGIALYDAFATNAGLSLPIAGTGVICLSSAVILVCAGIFGELVYKLGDLRESQFSRLTQQISMSRRARTGV